MERSSKRVGIGSFGLEQAISESQRSMHSGCRAEMQVSDVAVMVTTSL